MLTAVKGEKIVCSSGHVCGELDVDVQDGDVIASSMLQLKLFERVDLTPDSDGHVCRACNERITVVRNGAYRIHTARGWIGHIP